MVNVRDALGAARRLSFNMNCRGPKVGDTMFLIGNASGEAQMT
jgi:hypothetical protein